MFQNVEDRNCVREQDERNGDTDPEIPILEHFRSRIRIFLLLGNRIFLHTAWRKEGKLNEDIHHQDDADEQDCSADGLGKLVADPCLHLLAARIFRVVGTARPAKQALDVHGRRHDRHPDCPDDGLDDAQFVEFRSQSSACQMRDQPVRDTEERQDDRSGYGQMEVTGNPDRIMDKRVHLVGSVDDPAGPARNESDHPDEWRKETDIFPRQFLEPAEQARIPFFPSSRFECGKNRESRHQCRNDNHECQHNLDEFPCRVDAGLGELVVETDRNGEHQ